MGSNHVHRIDFWSSVRSLLPQCCPSLLRCVQSSSFGCERLSPSFRFPRLLASLWPTGPTLLATCLYQCPALGLSLQDQAFCARGRGGGLGVEPLARMRGQS